MTLSIVLPCYNDERSLLEIVPRIRSQAPDAELIVVDDGSSPPVSRIAGIRLIRHVYNMGNGAAVKTGIRAATGTYVLLMDADGQHRPEDIPRLLAPLSQGYDMVVGARNLSSQSVIRRIGNVFYNRLASAMTGYRIDDLTSGFRVARGDVMRQFLYLLPNGFSYPTTLTMAFFRSGLSVGYVPIQAERRQGQSNIRLLHDGLRFLIIILKVGALFSPMRFFLPVSMVLFILATSYYGYTYLTAGRFTNMGAVLYLSSLFVFCIGLVSEQVSALHYQSTTDAAGTRSSHIETTKSDASD